MHKKRILTGLFLAGLVTFSPCGATVPPVRKDTIRVHFLQEQYRVPEADSLEITSTLREHSKTGKITGISVRTSSSPEWDETVNRLLETRRAEALRNVFLSFDPALESLTDTKTIRNSWDDVYRVAREKGITLPDETSWNTRTPERKALCIRWYQGGIHWESVKTEVLPLLREGTVIVSWQEREVPERIQQEEYLLSYSHPGGIEHTPSRVSFIPPKKTIVLLKTNLLRDLTLVPEIEAEVPLGRHFSVNGELALQPFKTKGGRAWQFFNIGIEGRLRFPSRKHDRLTGPFLGVYAEGGVFDFRPKDTGIQAHSFSSTGFTIGYTVPTKGKFSVEFCVGAGISRADYNRYSVSKEFGNRIIKETGYTRATGITKGKISLCYKLR